MKRTIRANIGGMLFNIEDDACDRLESYLHSLESEYPEDIRRETIEDIENRIAEILNSRTNNRKRVVEISDVEAAIQIIGVDPENASQRGSYKSNWYNKYSYKSDNRLFRVREGKVIAGVCTGLGRYFDVDPIIIRLLFLVAFFGFGSGFIIYIILWIIMPKMQLNNE